MKTKSYFVLNGENINKLQYFIRGESNLELIFKEKKEKPDCSYWYNHEKGVYVGSIIEISSKEELEEKLYDYACILGDDFDIEVRYGEYKDLDGYRGTATINIF